MSSKDRIEALEAGAGVVETRTGKLAGSEKREAKEQEGQMELAFPPTEDEKEQEAVIEAVLFTMGRSVELRQLAAAIGQPEEVARKAVERLIKRYRSARSGMEITQLEDSYQMCTKAAYYENLIRVASAPKKQVLTEVVLETLSIIALGLTAFLLSTAGGLIFGNVMYVLTKGKVNPLIGSAGVSAVPMAARVAQTVGQKENPSNFLLMHAMGPNVAGVIGSAVAAGFMIKVFGG